MESGATLGCTFTKFSERDLKLGVEFYEFASSFDDSLFQIPIDAHSFTFQEELRLLKRATGLVPNEKDQFTSWIDNKMKIVYGDDCVIHIVEMEENKNLLNEEK